MKDRAGRAPRTLESRRWAWHHQAESAQKAQTVAAMATCVFAAVLKMLLS